ncbi:HAMP domain-containing histidine kinase [Streptomyces sp. G44]|uniref:sensor histidine kinase n=1 Tax=Streptomyces sp. G44 TaxID=2807632 RepID=UPI00195F5C5A|nr:HAMP domain-containing sensor histidine kinase [Streptomyces sp. G44]MBM7166997.1 HAMP domain-containing histidine kinase [Streptomyces sp. G44]
MRLPSLAAPAPAARRRLTPRRIGVRLTLLYGALFVVSGAVLLAITYLLVARSPAGGVLIGDPGGEPLPAPGDGAGGEAGAGTGTGPPGTHAPFVPGDIAGQLRAQASRQRREGLRQLLAHSVTALALMLVVSLVLGRLIAGRALRPLRAMTGAIQRVCARTLHERLAVEGPADELKVLADTVDGLLGRLEAALDAHRRFVANAAHELRTPLTLEHALLEESLIDRDATTESFRANFARLLAISEQQARLLDSLLTLAASQRGLDHREPLDLALVAERTLDAARPEIERRRLRADASIGPATTVGDPTLVQSLVTHLVDNAVRHNAPGGRVEIATRTRDGRAVVAVANTGPRVPPERVELLFEPFQRLSRTAGEGHGLGLAVVRAVATAHEAALGARVRSGGGLTVEVAFSAGPDGSHAAARRGGT